MFTTPSVEEFQGLYGPFQVSELVLQRIWLKSAFDTSRLRADDGRSVAVTHPGDWNRLAGPDFKNAILSIGGERIEGDVEVHFSVRDWRGHGHGDNPEFDNVVLHVVLYPSKSDDLPTRTQSGMKVPTVSLLDCLWYDLEEYASEDSIVESTGMSVESAIESLLGNSAEQCRVILQQRAQDRWRMKCGYARKRIERLGWEGACHLAALEILGYSENRIPMLRVAGARSLADFREDPPTVEALYEIGGDLWTTRGTRPANYPRMRLDQYRKWVGEKPHWPKELEEWASQLPKELARVCRSTDEYRKTSGMPQLKRGVVAGIIGSKRFGGTKLDTLVCDGFLPLVFARTQVPVSQLWFHWYVGDAPLGARDSLRKLGVLEIRRFPLANGWVQGLLSLRLSEANRPSVPVLG